MLTPQQPKKSWMERVAEARERFGKKFAYEPGSEWKPANELLLTRWLRERQTEKAKHGNC